MMNCSRVVALKIFSKQDKLLRVLVNSGLYSSISEGLRTAIWDFIKIKTDEEEGKSDIGVNDDITNKLLKEYEKQFKSPTVSITAKFPISMISTVDSIVNKKKKFKNRSDFFRIALTSFLVADSKLFSPFLLENKINSQHD